MVHPLISPMIEGCVKSITTGIREFGTYDPFDKGYAMDFVSSPRWDALTPEEASTVTAEILDAVEKWMVRVEYDTHDVEEITSYFARNFAMDWDESFEGDENDYETFVTHDPRILEFVPDLVNGY